MPRYIEDNTPNLEGPFLLVLVFAGLGWMNWMEPAILESVREYFRPAAVRSDVRHSILVPALLLIPTVCQFVFHVVPWSFGFIGYLFIPRLSPGKSRPLSAVLHGQFRLAIIVALGFYGLPLLAVYAMLVENWAITLIAGYALLRLHMWDIHRQARQKIYATHAYVEELSDTLERIPGNCLRLIESAPGEAEEICNEVFLHGRLDASFAFRAAPERVYDYFRKQPKRVNMRGPSGLTPLMIAAAGNVEELVKFLIEHGADVNAVDNSGKTALHLAVSVNSGGIEWVVAHLIEGGANVNVRTDWGSTPLSLGSWTRQWGLDEQWWTRGPRLSPSQLMVMRQLIQSGADVDIPRKEGGTCIDEAINYKLYDVAHELIWNDAVYKRRRKVT